MSRNTSRISFLSYFLFLVFCFTLVACHHSENNKEATESISIVETDTSHFLPLEKGQQTIKLNNIAVDIILPDGKVKGDLLVLPGWNFSRDRWCKDSDLCTKALAKGYRLILPEMGLSVYATHYFPQTRIDWSSAPTGTWLVDTLIPHLQHTYGILIPDKRNFIIGLSTGGRGVAITAIRTKKLFCAGVSLSGDFDQIQTPYDNVMAGFYGPYQDNKTLWETMDNPAHDAASLQVPLYLGHGLNDPIVPSQQTKSFYQTLQKANPKLKVILHISDTGLHDFNYWNSEIDAALNFFENY